MLEEDGDMKRWHHTLEQIVRKMRGDNCMFGAGRQIVEVCKHLEVTELKYVHWQNQRED
jgi:hypothetical protein